MLPLNFIWFLDTPVLRQAAVSVGEPADACYITPHSYEIVNELDMNADYSPIQASSSIFLRAPFLISLQGNWLPCWTNICIPLYIIWAFGSEYLNIKQTKQVFLYTDGLSLTLKA